jgi:hypothetical protein
VLRKTGNEKDGVKEWAVQTSFDLLFCIAINVCFWPLADILIRPPSAQSGHFLFVNVSLKLLKPTCYQKSQSGHINGRPCFSSARCFYVAQAPLLTPTSLSTFLLPIDEMN